MTVDIKLNGVGPLHRDPALTLRLDPTPYNRDDERLDPGELREGLSPPTASPTLCGWLAQWNTTTVPNGTYTVHSVASYAGGVSGTSPPTTITVSN